MNYEEFKDNYIDLKEAGFWVDEPGRKELISEWVDSEVTHTVNDLVNSPDHYTRGKQEAIVTIEDAISSAPGPVTGLLQGNALKYLIRLWSKSNALQDAKKARWYLDRLIARLEGEFD